MEESKKFINEIWKRHKENKNYISFEKFKKDIGLN